jgi:uncharacterized protein
MLLEFSVANYRSIADKQTLSLVAGSGSNHAARNVVKLDGDQNRCLRSAVIYGPNAAGKSNLLKAVLTLQHLVLTTASSQEGVPLGGITPFALDGELSAKPSFFSIVFIADDGVKYEYSFSATTKHIETEWLVAYPSGRPQRWFERKFNFDTQKYEWWFGSKFRSEKSEKKIWSDFTRSNSLFLSTAVQLNNEQLKPCFNWIKDKLIVLTAGVGLNPMLSINLIKENQASQIMGYLKAADIGIDEISVEEKDFDPAAFGQPGIQISPSFSQGVRIVNTPDEAGNMRSKIIQIITGHISNQDQMINLTLDDESDGTRKLFEYAGGWIRSLQWGATLLVDELERSLHPHITKFLVELFHSSHNVNNAQLIFTTHNTNLLDPSLLRRDQIWFVERNPKKATELYSLLEYKPRKEEALERGYLKGRYGAVPLVGDI